MATPAITLSPENYINRELSWLDFNNRVLAEAEDESLPLLDRVKFLAIVSSNLDEFFMVRVASIHAKLAINAVTTRPDGIPYTLLMQELRERVETMMEHQRELLTRLMARLHEEGLYVVSNGELPENWRTALRAFFEKEVFPVLTPLAVDHARPFPFISNLSLNLAVSLKRDHKPEDADEFVRIKVPDTNGIDRLINLETVMRKYGAGAYDKEIARSTFVWIEDVMGANLDLLFPGMQVNQHSPFRLTRNADIDFEHEQDDFNGETMKWMTSSRNRCTRGSSARSCV